MKHLLTTASVLLLVATNLSGQATLGNLNKDDQSDVVVPYNRFEGTATIKTKSAAPASLHLVKKNWGIHGRQKIERFPEPGFMIVHLHSGLVTTMIDGKEEKRKTGDYWTVPAGTQMSLQVTSESASLETFSIK
jgi:quercetin dioxygenase-like cupin family protein